MGAAAELRISCLNMSRQMKGRTEQTDGTDQCCIFIPLKWECNARIHQGVLQSQGNNEEERRLVGERGGVSLQIGVREGKIRKTRLIGGVREMERK